MPRFFLPSDSFDNEGGQAVITGQDARHIALALRMAEGDPILLCDMRQNEYSCVITSIRPDRVCARICEVSRSQSEPPSFITLYQCIAKGDKMDTVIQKAVETGVCRIVPVRSDRCVAKITADAEAQKVGRWQKIAAEAAGQSGRGIVPEVCPPVSFGEALSMMERDRLYFICYEGDGTLPLPELLKADTPESVSFLIGPEGGISQSEIALAASRKTPLAGLGKRILRTETASSFVLSCISFRYELGGIDQK